MSKVDYYREQLKSLDSWDDYLLENSGLPAARANLELADAVIAEGDETLFLRLSSITPEEAPINSPEEFLAFCGVSGLGKLIAIGRSEMIDNLVTHASDPRWRIREATARALTYWGKRDFDGMFKLVDKLHTGNFLEQRAAVAGISSPSILIDERRCRMAISILDGLTSAISNSDDRKSEDFKTLRKAMAYCWSVVLTSVDSDTGLFDMEKWFVTADKDILWIMKENLKKKRLDRRFPEWSIRWRSALGVR